MFKESGPKYRAGYGSMPLPRRQAFSGHIPELLGMMIGLFAFFLTPPFQGGLRKQVENFVGRKGG